MAARYHGFRGGYRFRRFAGSPGPEIEVFGLPDTVCLQLTPAHTPAKVGQRVQAGENIAQAGTAPSSPLAAPISGTVARIVGGAQIVIASDGSDAVPVSARRYPEWRTAAREDIEDILYLSGLTGFVDGGIPTRHGSSKVGPEDVAHILVEATSSDVWSPNWGAFLDPGRLTGGLGILRRILPNADATVVLDRSERALAARLEAALSGVASVLCVRSRYPLHHMSVLLRAVLGRRLSPGGHALDAGALVLDPETVMQVHDLVVEGMPPVGRTVALAGPGFSRNVQLRVRLGTPIGAIAERYGDGTNPSRIVINSPISGEAVGDADLGVGPDCRLLGAIPENHAGELLAFARPGFVKDSFSRTFMARFLPLEKTLDTNLHGEGRACISCGFCEEVCPAGIMPQLLHRYVRRDIIDETIVRYRIEDCIDCNLCSYVCPSKIPVAQLMREGKARLVQEGLLKA
jgi:Na+-translocating ferredoxin:NAD+ oxidoreductase RnfC subunit